MLPVRSYDGRLFAPVSSVASLNMYKYFAFIHGQDIMLYNLVIFNHAELDTTNISIKPSAEDLHIWINFLVG